jgi:phytoene dehydrogenase-like protein
VGESFDVIVAGGGPAGIAAAISAAASGAQTLLAERSDVLGGNAGNALVHTICGLYVADRDGAAEYAHEGFPRRFAELLRRRGAAGAPERAGRVHVLPTYPHLLAAVARDVCTEQANLTVWCAANLTAAAADGAGVELRFAREGAEVGAAASIAIDTTGDANLATLLAADCEQEPAERLQNPSYIFRVGGVDPIETQGFARLRISHATARAEALAELPPGAGSVLVRPGPVRGEAYVTLNVAKPADRPYAPLDEQALAELTAGARRNAVALVAYLRRHRPGFADCEVVEWPRRIGVRETRRVSGVETMTADDIVSGRLRDDEVARSTWPIELWHDHKGARYVYPDGPCSVPLGALISGANPRLGMAGRCMSASHEALGALRVIGTALASGAAIGGAAALAASRTCTLRDIPAGDVARDGRSG